MQSSLRNELDKVEKWDDFFQTRQKFSASFSLAIFDELFQISISGREGRAPFVAGCLLVELQPDSPHDLLTLLSQINESKWFVSFREIPFYLISQFGKHAVIEGVNQIRKKLNVNDTHRSRVDTVAYWASMSASDLCKHFHEWEFESYDNDA